MVNIVDDRKDNSGTRGVYLALMVFGGIMMNICGSKFVGHFEIPLYLDSVGTMTVSMLGGFLPGIFVGFFSSFLNSIFTDSVAISYSMINVLIAILTTVFYEKKWFKDFYKIILAVLIYGFVGGVLGAILTGIIYGFGSETASLNFLKIIYESGKMSAFQAALIADYIVDVADKMISVLIALLITFIIPARVRDRLNVKYWHQAPLTRETVQTMRNAKSRRISLRLKVVILLTLATGLVAFCAIFISTLLFRDAIIQTGKNTVHIAQEIGSYSGVDLSGISPYSEEETGREVFKFATRQISLFIGLYIFILGVGIYMAEYHLILPINTMALTSSRFSDGDEEKLEKSAKMFDEIKIRTGDEIENMYGAFLKMIEAHVASVQALKSRNETITALQNSIIYALADLVESRDQSTGEHVKNTAEYTKIIMNEMIKEGIYTDLLTPQFVSDVYHSAPLHDVGKISISDNFLNKPGKLTPEEFTVMKTHSKEGAMIIDKVMSNLPEQDAGYLKEAKNLAMYHHERWDGTGYPMGLKGEEIPLSARIMAVADVFDALISERSYKKAFPFDEAIKIIKESSGTHFDPKVAQAFLNALEEVRKIADV